MPKKKGKKLHVIPGSNGWAVKPEGGKRPSSVRDTQHEAIEAARDRPQAARRTGNSQA